MLLLSLPYHPFFLSEDLQAFLRHLAVEMTTHLEIFEPAIQSTNFPHCYSTNEFSIYTFCIYTFF